MKNILTLILALVALTMQAQSGSSSDAMSVDGASVNNVENELRIAAYPNPTSGIITIESQELISGYEIYNVSGQLAARKRIFKRRKRKRAEQVDLSLLPDGVYFIQVELESGFLLKQILKQ